MRVTGKYASKCPVSLQCHKVYWKPKLFSYLIPSHTYMETVVTSQNSITAFGLVKSGLWFWVPSLKQVIYFNRKIHAILLVG